MQTALRISQIAENAAHTPDHRALHADDGPQIPFPFRHFPLRRMQDAGGVMQGAERISQIPADVLQTAEDGVHFPEDGMQSAMDVTHCADNVKPPPRGGFHNEYSPVGPTPRVLGVGGPVRFWQEIGTYTSDAERPPTDRSGTQDDRP